MVHSIWPHYVGEGTSSPYHFFIYIYIYAWENMKNKKSAGFSLVEVMIVVGMMAGISLAIVGFMNNMFKSVATVQKNMNRTDTMKAISTALSNKETCKAAMGAGTLSIPASWATGTSNALAISQIKVGSEVLAEVDKTIDNITIKAMRLEMISGPYPVQYNIAAPAAPPDLKAYRRYFAKLTVTPVKAGGASNNLGGDTFKDNDFRVAILVSHTNILQECFGGIEESDLIAFCEKAFDGKYNNATFPWCTPLQLSIGEHRTTLSGEYPRFSVLEKQNSTNPLWDLTMALYGNGAGSSNGPGLWFAANPATAITNPGRLAVLGYANRADAYATGSKAGDFVVNNVTPNGDIHVGTTSVVMKLKEAAQEIAINRGVNIVAAGSAAKHPLSVNSPTGQGRIVVSGASDAGETYSAVYLSNTEPTLTQQDSWVLAHKAATSGFLHSLHIARWAAGTMQVGIAITPTMNVGIGWLAPTEKLQVAGNAVVMGNISSIAGPSGVGNITAAGTVTAASDIRLKKDILALDKNLERVLQLKPVSFRWKTDHTQAKQIGFIAQDLEKVVPEVVLTSADGMKSVAYGNLVSLIAGAIKEISNTIQNILAKILAHQTQIQSLEQKLTQVLESQHRLEQKNKILETQIQKCSMGK